MFYFFKSFKSLLVLLILVETAVLPMKASEDAEDLAHTHKAQFMVLCPAKLSAGLTGSQFLFLAFLPGLLKS